MSRSRSTTSHEQEPELRDVAVQAQSEWISQDEEKRPDRLTQVGRSPPGDFEQGS